MLLFSRSCLQFRAGLSQGWKWDSQAMSWRKNIFNYTALEVDIMNPTSQGRNPAARGWGDCSGPAAFRWQRTPPPPPSTCLLLAMLCLPPTMSAGRETAEDHEVRLGKERDPSWTLKDRKEVEVALRNRVGISAGVSFVLCCSLVIFPQA